MKWRCLVWASGSARKLALMITLVLSSATVAAQQGAGALRALHEQLKPQLAASPFGRPLLLESSVTADDPHGDVYAVLDHSFATVAGVLQRPEQWCDLLLLQINVKRCAASGRAPRQALRMAVGSKFDQPIADAFQLDFKYAVRASTADHLSVQLAAEQGPLGTQNYRLAFEAVAIDSRRTFVHMSYAYASGLAARLATNVYLATAGRSKVGFTTVTTDGSGKAVPVGGVRGIAERNAMRYFLAIETLLGTLNVPAAQRTERRLRDWFAATERHPRQLHEMALEDYLAMKRREVPVPTATDAVAGS